MKNPLVSIVICCHNRRDYLKKTLESVFVQNYKPVEIIVMDDGSTDGTQQMVSNYSNKISYFWQESQGIAVARTEASQLAQGEYIAYQDDDDIMPPDRITHLYQALLEYPEAIFATGDYALIDPDGILTGKRWLSGSLEEIGPPRLIKDGHAAVLWPRVPAVPHTTLFKKEYGEQIGWFDHDFKYACSDADFLARLGMLGPIVYLREIVSHYRRGHDAIWNDDLRSNYSRLQLWDKHLGLIRQNGSELKNRLHNRIYISLKKIAKHNSMGLMFSDPRYEKFKQRGLAHLNYKQSLLYYIYAFMKLPTRSLVKKYI
jgi:glycosyltransferase involved in cell wall biosynthesis